MINGDQAIKKAYVIVRYTIYIERMMKKGMVDRYNYTIDLNNMLRSPE